MRKILFSFLFSLQVILAFGQNASIGQWQEYLSNRKPISVIAANGRVYCVTTSGFFWLSILDNSLHQLSKVNGLSDIEAVKVSYNSQNKKTLIIYKNANLDIIEVNGVITNVPDIKNKALFGNKAINNVYMNGPYAYLACGFGIVVLDMEKEEIKESYNMDPAGSAINVRDITMDGQYIYASTDNGVYQALKTSNLTIYTSWTKMNGLAPGVYNAIAVSNGKLFANLSKKIMTGNSGQDEIYVYENGAWGLSKLYNFTCRAMKSSGGKLLVTTEGLIYLYDDVTGSSALYSNFNGSNAINCYESDIDEDGNLWIADQTFGLIKCKNWGGSEAFFPPGPITSNVYAMAVGGENLWIVPGGLTQANGNTYTVDGISIKHEDQWTILSGMQPLGNTSNMIKMDTVFDLVNIVVDPVNPRRAYAASFASGLVELYDRKVVALYNMANSSLQPAYGTAVWTYGLAFDSDNNLWVSNSNTFNYFSVKRTNGTWKSFNFSNVTPKLYVANIIVDKNNQKWGVVPGGGGLVVFKGGVNDVPSNANTKWLSVAVGNGHLPSPGVFSIAEDKDGEIWVGTDKGVCVFYNPESVFSGQNFDAQTIKLEQDGNVQLLLETETVQAIAVDDGNRKWLATAGSGVYLMSPDGTKQIHHFDAKNSPLFSNNVKSIAIDRKTGEVLFGTDKGIISYRGDAVEGNEDFTDVYAYPNPVKDNYSGPIVIKGLVENTTVKITDISGTFVCELNSIGGQAIWNAKNFKGERVSTGVYMVFCTNEDGSKKIATKIMVIN
jgi:ligand-binding sensor domain-containing protein